MTGHWGIRPVAVVHFLVYIMHKDRELTVSQLAVGAQILSPSSLPAPPCFLQDSDNKDFLSAIQLWDWNCDLQALPDFVH